MCPGFKRVWHFGSARVDGGKGVKLAGTLVVSRLKDDSYRPAIEKVIYSRRASSF